MSEFSEVRAFDCKAPLTRSWQSPIDQVLSIYKQIGITPVFYGATEDSNGTWVDGY